MSITKHRQRILEALQEWFRTHEEGPTLEELCQLLGMHPRQKATVQRWLQTMRGIDVEWEAHSARSLRLLLSEPEEVSVQIPMTETLRYLATGLVEWHLRSRLVAIAGARISPYRHVSYVFNFSATGRRTTRKLA